MSNIIYNLFFLAITIVIFIKTVSYALYELNSNHNKYGCYVIIILTIIAITFSNIMIWIR